MEGTMKAVVMVESGKAVYKDVPIPHANDDEMVIKVKAAGICGGDMTIYYGKVNPPSFPVTLGHEYAGEIAYVGKNVPGTWKVGDRVVHENTYDVCGVCPACVHGNFVNCAHRMCTGYSHNGAFTTYVKLPAHLLQVYPNSVLKLPDSISFKEAAVFEPASNSYKAVVQEGGLRPGENIVIFGSGPMGIMCAANAQAAGAANIIMVGLSSDVGVRSEVAAKYGVKHFLCSDKDDVVAKVHEICGEYGVRLAIDAAGAPITLHLAIQLVHNEGTIVRIGKSPAPYGYSLDDLTCKSITLRGHEGYNTESWQRVISMADAGILDVSKAITQILPMSEFHQGFELMRTQQAAKVILLPEEE